MLFLQVQFQCKFVRPTSSTSDLRLGFQIDLPGVENYGFEGESSFMRCKHGAVAADSDEASRVGR